MLKEGELLGFVKIEKINVCLPIYEGTNNKVLLKGTGHLENTGMPTKKGEYHSVIVGHTGLTAKKIFDDLPKLNIGDEFNITILNDTFKYKIYSIEKVLPNETENLKTQKGKQLVTLVTCTPKFINSHRLLVKGKIIK